ncbi:exported hypothetical protein [uncultured Desulfovibrio sp.]|uniref:Uncharacterized protein n=1 Tax=uncultured Desulfovibrio sp. TaxID=167968 RepID=A0A212L6D5_9BACT|nr:exported hypothetical protein [uncultured Desulfovibrio sp.]VZH33968.1 conserved protein of unknown function [Desulfovibrio sp. 86]
MPRNASRRAFACRTRAFQVLNALTAGDLAGEALAGVTFSITLARMFSHEMPPACGQNRMSGAFQPAKAERICDARAGLRQVGAIPCLRSSCFR